MSHLQCRLTVFASTSRNTAVSFRRHLEGELARYIEARGINVVIEARPDGKGVVTIDVPARLGGRQLLRALECVESASGLLLRIYPEWKTSQVVVTGDGVKSYRQRPAELEKKKRQAMKVR